jgi:hypothetical protein
MDNVVLEPMPTGVMTRDEVPILQRREKAVRLRAQGQSIRAISSQLGVSIPVVQEDLRWVKQDWLRRIARNKAAWMAEVLGEIAEVAATAWEDYLASGAATREKAEETSEKGTKSRRSQKTRNRDPRYLSIIIDATKFKSAVLGLGDKTAVDRVDDVLGKRQPKLLVVRDRAQLAELIDITQMVDLDIRGPKSYGDRLRKKPLAIEGQEDESVPDDDEVSYGS